MSENVNKAIEHAVSILKEAGVEVSVRTMYPDHNLFLLLENVSSNNYGTENKESSSSVKQKIGTLHL